MQEPFFIKKVAVLGAGVMGAQIAAHCVNAGIETLLFDLAAPTGAPNGLIDKAITNLTKLKPAPLATPHTASLLKAQNYEENLSALLSCDLIIEAIAERLDWKEALYQKISPYLQENAILVSNTSGLSINALAQVLPKQHQQNFCGVHFFNPPRYMHLAELIPTNATNPDLLNKLETWLTSFLGKGVVRAKDTPNFIANRIGVFSLLTCIHHAMAMDIGFDEVDALTGPLLGRPKSATFRTMDVVGLDTMAHVVNTMHEQLTDDPWHKRFILPNWLNQLITEGHLGQKTGQGIYRKSGKTIEVFDLKTQNYRPTITDIPADLKTIMKTADPASRMEQLMTASSKQAQFLAACFIDLFHYCAFHQVSIAHNVRDVDLAIRWGFGWQQGPYETWQLAGLKNITSIIEKAITTETASAQAPLPHWLKQIDAFYTSEGAYSPQNQHFEPRSDLPVYARQFFPDKTLKENRFPTPVLYENEGVCLKQFKDDVALLSFKTKANTIGQSVLDGLEEALEYSNHHCQGIIFYQDDGSNFSSGADLRGIAQLIQANKMQALDEMIVQFQQVLMRIKYAPIPTIAAVRGRALGGGTELLLHCSAVVAAFESYPGLVEVGVGVIPAGGGSKEMALRAANLGQTGDLMDYLQQYFQQIAMAQVAGSAPEATQMGYFKNTDICMMHVDEVLFTALAKVKLLQASNYQPPLVKPFKIAGIEGHARLQTGLINWLEGGFMTEHDYTIVNKAACVLCGGNLNQGTLVNEEWILALEREAFLQLAAMPATQARITQMLETGKPLRN